MGRSRQKQPRVTIQDVAARAGVSAMTVSNVVNCAGKVGADTRARVLAAVEALGYVPSQAARNLAGAAPARIGVLYADVESLFLSAALAECSVAVAGQGLQMLVRRADGAEPPEQAARALVRSGADALLLLPPFAELLSGTGAFQALAVPAAAIATAQPLADMATVRIDNFSAARALTELLLARGCRRVATITGPAHHSDSRARLDGHRAALAARGLPELVVAGDFTFASGLAAANILLDRDPRPDAIVAANDDMAAAVLWAAHSRGLNVPRDLSVTGFDDTLLATRVWPTLTTIRQPIRPMVATAVALLTEALAGGAAVADRVLDFALVERDSVRRGDAYLPTSQSALP